jgi:NAD(P)H dehydrogenase (quinone)
MKNVKLAIIFYSTYGTNHQMAEVAAEAARATGAQVRLLKVKETAPWDVVNGQEAWKAQVERTASIPEVTHQDMEWANAYLFSAPTRYGVAASQLRAFIDTLGPLWTQGKLSDKAVSAMSSAQNPHGGQEATILSLYTTFMHWGTILVPPGYTDQVLYAAGGNPYGTTVTATGEPLSEESKAAIRHQTKRLIQVAAKLATGAVDRAAAA